MMMVGDSNSRMENMDIDTTFTTTTSLASSYVIYIHNGSNSPDDMTVKNNDSTVHKHCSSLSWTLLPLNQVQVATTTSTDVELGVGTIAIQGLKSNLCDQSTTPHRTTKAITLTCQMTHNTNNDSSNNKQEKTIEISVVGKDEEDDDNDNSDDELDSLIATLSRVMIQQYLNKIDQQQQQQQQQSSTIYKLTLPSFVNETLTYSNSINNDPTNILLFKSLLPEKYQNNPDIEMSDMVNSNGDILGSIPRILVHQYNILHRGIGIMVYHDDTKNDSSNTHQQQHFRKNVNVYCHQRTSTKRIFPSLYDMFVGGVSTSGEDSVLTAAREVGEELGLTRALRYIELQQQHEEEEEEEQQMLSDSSHLNENSSSVNMKNPLSDELFKCTVCTSYNRCVVTMFTYQYCNTDDNNNNDVISWQEEEVSWGDFVPYAIVEKAASLSIQRLIEKNEWPGTGIIGDESEIIIDFEVVENGGDDGIADGVMSSELKKWKEWDFVPDGLLVWIAWLQWIQSKTE